MFLNRSVLQNASPTSAEEVLSLLTDLFAATGMQRVTVALSGAPPSGAGPKGASFCVTLPIVELEALFHRAVETAAGEQGIQVSRSQLRFTQDGPDRLAVAMEADARAFLGAVTVRVTGALVLHTDGTLRFDGLKLDTGSGMFAGMAGAVLRPKLARLGEQVIDLRRASSGLGLRVTGLRATAQNVEWMLEVV